MPNGSEDILTIDFTPIGMAVVIQWPRRSNLFHNHDDGLRFTTTSTIGKDRNLYYQLWDRSNSNLWLPNVVGF